LFRIFVYLYYFRNFSQSLHTLDETKMEKLLNLLGCVVFRFFALSTKFTQWITTQFHEHQTDHVGFVVKSLTPCVFRLCLRAPNSEQTKTDYVHHALTSITNETNFRVSHGPTAYYFTSCLFSSTLNQLAKPVDIFSSKDEIHTLTQVLNITSIILNQEMIIEHPNPVLGPLLISTISKILYELSSHPHPKT
jgi:hypothetical protein